MPVDVERIKIRMNEMDLTVKDVVNALGIDESTYYRKMANNGKTFSVEQAQKLSILLDLTKQEASEIFYHKTRGNARTTSPAAEGIEDNPLEIPCCIRAF